MIFWIVGAALVMVGVGAVLRASFQDPSDKNGECFDAFHEEIE